jgi:RNA polymerase sigma factor (sigma-70 family)
MHEDDLRNRFTAYMQKVVYHAKVDYIRRKKAQHPNTEADAATTPEFSYEQDFSSASDTDFDFEEQRLANSFASLPLIRKQILKLLFVQGLTAMEVAEELGCSLDYVYSNKRRALQKLRDQMQEGVEFDDV